MPRKRHTAEEVVAKLRQVDVLTAQGGRDADFGAVLRRDLTDVDRLGSTSVMAMATPRISCF